MEKLIKLLSRVRIKFRRSSSLTKTVVLSAVALSMAALLTLQLTIKATREKADDLKNEAAQLEQENKDLEDKVDGLGSADSIEQIAGDDLGMVPTDAVVIQPGQ